MFSKISRYRDLPEVAVADRLGRTLESKRLRLLPETPGTFLHAVEELDRLDHLAFKYYDQPRDWWRIADANPAFLSPLALLGNEPWRTVRIPLAWDGPWPLWADLLRALRETAGVETARPGTEEQDEAELEILEGAPALDLGAEFTAELDASVRTRTLASALATELSLGGIDLAGEVEPVKVDAATWRIIELRSRRILTFRHFPDEELLRVYESAYRFRWMVTVTHNTLTSPIDGLLVRIHERGFAVTGPPAEVRRVGKPIVIPPRRA